MEVLTVTESFHINKACKKIEFSHYNFKASCSHCVLGKSRSTLPIGLSETRNFVLIWTVFTDTQLLCLAFLKGRRRVECKRGKIFQSTFGLNLHTALENNGKKEPLQLQSRCTVFLEKLPVL